jgi:uncharacterized protein YhfF
MDIPQAIRHFWHRYQATLQFDASPRFYEAFHFDDERSANELAELVLIGTKRATAGLLWSFDAANKQPSKPGDLSVVTNWQGKPMCIIETNVVTVAPFEEVPEDFAAAEGEGDKSLRHWREAHWTYFGRECQRIGKELSLRMPVVCERFAVIYPRVD